MTTATTGAGSRAGALPPLHKVGLGLAALLALADLYLPFMPHPGGDGPPPAVEWTAFGLGLITLAGVAWAFRSAAPAARWLIAGSRVVSALLALPAFFVDAPTGIKVLAAALVALTAVTVVLVLTPHRISRKELRQ